MKMIFDFLKYIWEQIKWLAIYFTILPLGQQILIIIGLIILGTILFDFFNMLRVKRLFSRQHGDFQQFCGYTIAISGRIRAGKTTLMFSLMQLATEILISKIQKIINDFQLLAQELPFYKIDKRIEEVFFSSLNPNIEELANEIYDEYFMILDKKYSDEVSSSPKTYYDLLLDYIEAYMKYLDYQFVLCNVRCFSNVTKNYNKPFAIEMLDIKDRAIDNDFLLSKYSVVGYDEAVLDGNKSTQAIKVAAADTGRSDCKRLFGNMFSETCYFFSTDQRTAREVKEEREVLSSFIHVDGYKIITFRHLIKFLISILEKVINLFYGLLKIVLLIIDFVFNLIFKLFRSSKRFELKTKLEKKKNPYKIILRILKKQRDHIFSKSFIVYHTRIYYSERDVDNLAGNSSTTRTHEPYNFFFPIRYSFGSGDTHYFKFLYDILKNKSKYSLAEVEELVSLLSKEEKEAAAEKILKKRESW